MPFTSITIKNVASYDSTGVSVTNLRKLNFFFGYNGTGKSTIAKFLRNVSLPTAEQSADYSDCSCSGYDSSKENILVYDDIFKKENFVDTDKMKGIFSLNHSNTVIDKKISLIEEEIEKYESDYKKLAKRRSTAEHYLETWKKDMIAESFRCRDQFRGFVKQSLQYAHNKNQHFDHLRGVLDTNSPITSLEEIRSEYETLYEHELSEIKVTLSSDLINRLHMAEDNLATRLKKVIVGKDSVDIANLIKKLNMSGWVMAGQTYLQKSGDVCPFCQQPITNKSILERQLNEFFDDSYQKDIEGINEASEGYRQAVFAVRSMLEKSRNYEQISTLCADLLIAIGEVFSKNENAVRDKLNHPNHIVELCSLKSIDGKVLAINNAIQKNNEEVANIDKLRNEWVKKCWNLMAYDVKDRMAQYDRRVNYINQRLIPVYDLHEQFIDGKINYMRSQIKCLRNQTVNTKDAVDGINKILQNIGYHDFSIEETRSSLSSSQYRLKRNSAIVGTNVYHSLSEGEKTFISFLYFYQLCIGATDITKSTLKKIIVIDDPISSLDSQTLFVVSAIIHKMDIQGGDKHKFKDANISQIIILTHNLYFYKEISFDRRPMCKDVMHFRVQKPIGGFTNIESSNNAYPTDDYSLLWKSLKEYKTLTGVDECRNIMICNLMRRIIDSYVNFIGLRQGPGNLTWSAISSLSTTDPIYIVASSFISQINDESHGVSPFDSVYFNNVIRQDTSILFQAFKLVFNEIGTDHYNMMIV